MNDEKLILIDAVRLRLHLSNERDRCRRQLDEATRAESSSYWLGRAHGIEWAIDEIDSARTMEATK
jgi:hypothetical protein